MKFIRVLKANVDGWEKTLFQLVDDVEEEMNSHMYNLKETEYDAILDFFYIENEEEFRETGDYSKLKIVIPTDEILPAINNFLHTHQEYSINDLSDLLSDTSTEGEKFRESLYDYVRPYYIYEE